MSLARHQMLGAAQACVGLVLLARPQAALNELTGPDARSARWIARILGARLSVQGSAVALSGSPVVIDVGGAVDAIHAASMLLIAARSPRWRRPTLASAAFAGAGAVASRHAVPEPRR
ncbi:hypothetical protein M6D93_12160 [Jatrophihabitans telluris]|uniref:Uncharacterized protein n=1 Tax=Jatrophihabitans telluris TaxID=2038343 RepID=A0ABY4QUU0_9ACTN|nr:hypothetical protein [Jatrophihabitans telluris]UQX87059.1 hypothetical protein M6D93_12160 [Jatrophihabitans telluris]